MPRNGDAAEAETGGRNGGAPDATADRESAGPDIPEDVASATEELPPDFFDAAAAPAQLRPPARANGVRRSAERVPYGGDAAAREAPAPDPSPAWAGATDARAGRSPVRPTDLRSALLGSGASADELPDALRDAVSAIEELFPGTLVGATPRADAGQDLDESDDRAGPEEGAEGGGDDRLDAEEGPEAGSGNARLDFGPQKAQSGGA